MRERRERERETTDMERAEGVRGRREGESAYHCSPFCCSSYPPFLDHSAPQDKMPRKCVKKTFAKVKMARSSKGRTEQTQPATQPEQAKQANQQARKHAGKEASKQASKQAGRQAAKQAIKQEG